jgi:hypothetical protein
LAEALGERCRADLPAEHTGARGLRRRGAVLAAVVASTPSGVVAPCCSGIRPARVPGVNDVAGVAVQRPACVKEPLLGRRASLVGGLPRRSPCVHRGFDRAVLRAVATPVMPPSILLLAATLAS